MRHHFQKLAYLMAVPVTQTGDFGSDLPKPTEPEEHIGNVSTSEEPRTDHLELIEAKEVKGGPSETRSESD
jgi:hypothetical protein